jgi:hypothetical protein
MPFWFALVLFAASTILGQLFRPKTSQPKPVTLADLDFPTAEETRAIPKGYGTFQCKAPNVVSVTDFSSEAIIKKTRDPMTLFITTIKQKLGYKYFCGIEMAMSYRIDELLEIQVGDKVAWSGSVTTDSEIFINKPTLFGGNDPAANGNGGLMGYLGVHVGLPNATKDPYLVSQYGNYSAHRGVFYVVWKGQSRAKGSGWLGNSTRIDAWAFKARFIPNNLPYATYGYSNYSNINSGDANPAEVIYDIWRNSEYAIGAPDSQVDLASFCKAAQTFSNDGYGFSALWDTAKPCKDVITGILQYTDSVLYSDLQTGQLVLKPARADYVKADLPHFTDDDIIAISSFTRGAWAETTNEVKVPFINRLADFQQQTAQAQDLANQRIQGATISTNIQHLGISNPDTGANVAQRDLRAMTTPLAKTTIQVNLKAYKITPGSPFRFSTNRVLDHTGQPITELVMRCTGVKVGSPVNPVIEIEGVEDLFNTEQRVYASPPTPVGNSTSVAPVATATQVLDELPLMLAQNDTGARLWAMAKRPNTGTFTFDLYDSQDGVTYDDDDANNNFTPTGVLIDSYAADLGPVDNSATFTVVGATGTDLDKLAAATAAEVANGANLMLVIEGSKVEIMAFESFTVNGGGNYDFHNVWRGLLDTTPQQFNGGARVWFFSYGDARSNLAYQSGATGYAKLLTRTLQGVLDESAATALTRTMGVRALRPYAPGNLKINGTYRNGTLPGSGDITVAWAHRDRVRQGTVISQGAADVGLEGGASYTLKIYKETGTLLRTVTGLVATSYIYTNAQETADNGGSLASGLAFVLYATRDGITSYQAQIHTAARTASPVVPPFAPSGTYVAPAAGAATSIGGMPVVGSPTNTNNSLVYDPATGTMVWQPAASAITIREIDGTPSGSASVIEVPNGQLADMGGGVFRITPLAGANGTNGVDGTHWYTGSAVPASGLGVDGDFYYRSNLGGAGDGDIYQKSGPWSVVGNIKGVSGMPGTQRVISVTTSSTAPGTTVTGTIDMGAGTLACYLQKINSSKYLRLRLYKTAAHRTADAARAFGNRTYVGKEHGILVDVQRTIGGEPVAWNMSPDALCSNGETVAGHVLYYAITNLSTGATAITVDLTIIA